VIGPPPSSVWRGTATRSRPDHVARYIVSVKTPMSASDAFSYMADLRNFAEWDPGVSAVRQIDGDGPGPATSFDVDVEAGPSTITLRYVTDQFEAGSKAVVRARNSFLTSLDVITVTEDDGATIVTYDAELTLNGPLRLGDPLLAMSFGKIGDRAAAGLIAALDGERTEQPVT